jgi:hypothetical protein
MLLSGPQPCAAMAFLFVLMWAHGFCHVTLTLLKMSDHSSVAGKPARSLPVTVSAFAFLLSILNVPFFYTVTHLPRFQSVFQEWLLEPASVPVTEKERIASVAPVKEQQSIHPLQHIGN